MAKSWLGSAAVKKACSKGKWRAKASSFIKCAKAAHGGKKSPRRSGARARAAKSESGEWVSPIDRALAKKYTPKAVDPTWRKSYPKGLMLGRYRKGRRRSRR
jgi:hypothetical protein